MATQQLQELVALTTIIVMGKLSFEANLQHRAVSASMAATPQLRWLQALLLPGAFTDYNNPITSDNGLDWVDLAVTVPVDCDDDLVTDTSFTFYPRFLPGRDVQRRRPLRLSHRSKSERLR